jgi:hypothetical protein
MCDEEKIFVPGRLEQPKQDKNLLYRHDEPNKPTKDSSFVFHKSPFDSVSTVSRGNPSLVSQPLFKNIREKLAFQKGGVTLLASVQESQLMAA